MTAQYDGNTYDANLLLKDATGANLTATGSSTAISFKPELNKIFKAVVDVTSIDWTTEDETYVITIEASSDDTNYYAVATSALQVGGTYTTGKYELAICGQLCNKVVPGATTIRITYTLAGSTPILRFYAYLAMV